MNNNYHSAKVGDGRVGQNLSKLGLVHASSPTYEDGGEAHNCEKHWVYCGCNLDEDGEGCEFLSGGKDKSCSKVEALKNVWESKVHWGQPDFYGQSNGDQCSCGRVGDLSNASFTHDSSIGGASK